jgi:hypothetical protein
MLEDSGVPISKPGSVTVLGDLVKEREKRIGKLERSANVGGLSTIDSRSDLSSCWL